jgi:hypothetical protein
MILKILSKRIEQNMNLENGKGSTLSLPTLGLGPFFLPPVACYLPLPPFFSARVTP